MKREPREPREPSEGRGRGRGRGMTRDKKRNREEAEIPNDDSARSLNRKFKRLKLNDSKQTFPKVLVSRTSDLVNVYTSMLSDNSKVLQHLVNDYRNCSQSSLRKRISKSNSLRTIHSLNMVLVFLFWNRSVLCPSLRKL